MHVNNMMFLTLKLSALIDHKGDVGGLHVANQSRASVVVTLALVSGKVHNSGRTGNFGFDAVG